MIKYQISTLRKVEDMTWKHDYVNRYIKKRKSIDSRLLILITYF